MRKLGKRRLTLTLQHPLPALPVELAEWPLELEDQGGASSTTASTRRPRTPACRTLLRRLAELGIDFKDLDTTSTSARGHFRRFGGAGGMTQPVNLGGIWAIYRYELSRTVRTIWQSVATPVITTALYFIVFGSAIGSRMQRGRRRQLRRLHRARPDHAVASDPEPLERLDRHLLPEIHRHDLRDSCRRPMSSIEAVVGLCRRGGHEVGRHRHHHSRDRHSLRAGAHRASVLDGRLPRS